MLRIRIITPAMVPHTRMNAHLPIPIPEKKVGYAPNSMTIRASDPAPISMPE